MPPGRPRKPEHLRKLSGARPRKPVRQIMPDFDLKPPKRVEKNPGALEVWSEVAPLLSATRVVTAADRNMLARYCETESELRELQSEIAAMGSDKYVFATNGTVSPHPAFKMQARLRDQLIRYENELMLTPGSRLRRNLQQSPDADDDKPGLEQFIGGKPQLAPVIAISGDNAASDETGK